jgi:hypothetical protein
MGIEWSRELEHDPALLQNLAHYFIRSRRPAKALCKFSPSGLDVSPQPSADFAQIPLLTYQFLPNLLGFLFALGQVRFDLAPMTEVVRDHRVYVRQGERGIALHDLLRGRAVLEGTNNQF